MHTVTTLPEIKTFQVTCMNDGKACVVYFTTSWCATCKVFGPLLDGLSEKFLESVRFVKVQMDEDAISGDEIGTEFSIRKFPTVVVYDERGVHTEKIEGAGDVTGVERALKKCVGVLI